MPSSSISMLTSQEAVIPMSAADDATPPNTLPATVSIVTAPYPAAYSAIVGGNQLHFVPGAPGSYTVTINGKSADGTDLPVTVVNFTVADVAPPSQATHIVLGAVTLRTKDITTPGDPGSDTVTGSV